MPTTASRNKTKKSQRVTRTSVSRVSERTRKTKIRKPAKTKSKFTTPPAGVITKTINALVKKHGARYRKDIQRGVKFCAKVWDTKKHSADEFTSFCLQHYVRPGAEHDEFVRKFDEFINSIGGYFGMMIKAGRFNADVADKTFTPADNLFAAFSAASHFSEDLREFQIAALAQLNLGTDDLTPPKTPVGWAARRLSKVGSEFVPAELLSELSKVQNESQRFVSDFNIYLDRIDFGDPEITFPKDTRLISHWGLRDYMTGLHGSEHAPKRQRAVREIMRRVVDGELPRQILNNPNTKWKIGEDTVTVDGKKQKVEWLGAERWRIFKQVFDARKRIDPYTRHGNIIDNKFKEEREIPEATIVKILTDILSAKEADGVARFVQSRLGRPLEPHDIYFKDFHSGGQKSKLDYSVKERYPDSAALTKAIPDVVQKLGFKKDHAEWIGSKIVTHNSRSAGHAWRPYTPVDKQYLRVRVDSDGIGERDFSIFMHELGHCVEGVLSSYNMDYQSLWGVPNTAFSEGFAFTFQDRTDFVLGRKTSEDPDVTTLLRFWEAYEIAGPALVEIEFFHWLYKHPKATPEQINKEIRAIGDRIWRKYYARIFGPIGFGLMSVYSHMLWCTFYLADYPMGYVIAYQVRKYLQGKNLGEEMTRICELGNIYPEQWMRGAVGESISVKPLLTDTRAALKKLNL